MSTPYRRGRKIKAGGDKILYRCGAARKARLDSFCTDEITQRELLDIAVDALLARLQESGGLSRSEHIDYITKNNVHKYRGADALPAPPGPDATEFERMVYEQRLNDIFNEEFR